MIIDGSHTTAAVLSDTKLLHPLATKSTLLFYDDVEHGDVAKAVDTLVATKMIQTPNECISGETRVNYDHAPSYFHSVPKKYCTSKYVF